jgi:hypothetical protein
MTPSNRTLSGRRPRGAFIVASPCRADRSCGHAGLGAWRGWRWAEPQSSGDRRSGSGSEGPQVTLVGHHPVSSRRSSWIFRLAVRLIGQRAKPLRGGEDRDLAHQRSTSATRPTDSTSAHCLYQRAMPCYPPAWWRRGLARPPCATSRLSGVLPRPRLLAIYSIDIKAKAVPVAASSFAVASARPTEPEVRLGSGTALRIQRSTDHAPWGLWLPVSSAAFP